MMRQQKPLDHSESSRLTALRMSFFLIKDHLVRTTRFYIAEFILSAAEGLLRMILMVRLPHR
jgi:hypothetical protein